MGLTTRLKVWWDNFRRSKTRQFGTLSGLLVLIAIVALPSELSRIVVAGFIPVAWFLVFRLRKEKSDVKR
jgi:hypothetical protein